VAVSGVCVHRRTRRFGAVYLRNANGNFEGQVFRRVRGRWRYITGGSNWSGGPVLTAFLRHSGAACARRVVTIGANRCGTVVVEPNTEHAFVAVRASGIDCDAARARLLAWAQSGYKGQPEGLACSTLATVALAGTALRRCTGRRVAVEYIGSGAPDASAEAKKTCQKVTAGEERSPVYASHIACPRARRIVRRFVATDRLPRGWTSLNPAGCEHVIFRRRDRERIVRNGYRAPPGVPLVATIRMRGCGSAGAISVVTRQLSQRQRRLPRLSPRSLR
jgi:hypothetical protein